MRGGEFTAVREILIVYQSVNVSSRTAKMTHSIIFLQAAEQLEITICSTKVWCTNISKRSEVGNPLPKISSHLVRNPLNLQPNGDTGLLKICAPKSYHPLWNDSCAGQSVNTSIGSRPDRVRSFHSTRRGGGQTASSCLLSTGHTSCGHDRNTRENTSSREVWFTLRNNQNVTAFIIFQAQYQTLLPEFK